METKTDAQFLAELAVAYLATAFMMLAKNRADLADYFARQAEKMKHSAVLAARQ